MIKYSIYVKRLVEDMYREANTYELPGIDFFVMFWCLLADSAFAGAIEKSSMISVNDIEEELQSELEEAYALDFIETEPKENGEEGEAYNLKAIFTQNEVQFEPSIVICRDILDIFEYAQLIAEEEKRNELTIADLIYSMVVNITDEMQRFIDAAGIDLNKFKLEYFYRRNGGEFMLPSSISSFVTVLNDKFKDNPDCPIRGRDREIELIWQTMMKKSKRNVILVGEAGVGKSSIVYKLTCDIINGNCPKCFKDYKVLSLSVNALIAGTTYRGQAEERYEAIMNFIAENDNVILFIDEVHMIVGAGESSDGKGQDFANALKPLLAEEKAIVIGATTQEEYERTFAGEGALRRRFRKIVVNEPKTSEVYDMLKDSVMQLEAFHGVTISKKMVEFIILNSSCFNYETKNPDRTRDLIDLAMAVAKKDGKKVVDRASVLKNFDINIKSFKMMNEKVKASTAYHEIGHYVMWRMSEKLVDQEVIAVSIMPAENYLGVNVVDRTGNLVNRDNDYYIDYIAFLLAGRVCEKMFAGKYNSGASNDLEQATKCAYNMVSRYGMGNEIGKNRIYISSEKYPMQNSTTIEKINKEVEKLIAKAYHRAELVMEQNRELIGALVKELLRKGILSKKDLYKIVKSFETRNKVEKV